VLDGAGNLYVADTGNSTIRKVTPAGAVSTLAGLPTIGGNQDGTGSGAMFNQPRALTTDSSGNLYVADTGNSSIRRVTPAGVVATVAGLPGVAGLKDGTGTAAWFNQPRALALDASGNLFVADTGNAAIRKITPAGVVSTVNLSTGSTGTTGGSTTMASGSGGGGGAMGGWFVAALAALLALRWGRARYLSSILSAIGLAKVKGLAKEDP